MWKRKREASMEMGEEGGEGGSAVFAKNKKTPRSPGRIGERMGERKDEEKEWREVMGEWKRDMEAALKEVVSGIKEWNE
jgi:hypothetical protein